MKSLPISRKEWKNGLTKDALQTRILDFFTEKEDKAFKYSEIYDRIFPPSTDRYVTVDRLTKAINISFILQKLVREGKIEIKDVQGPNGLTENYYIKAK